MAYAPAADIATTTQSLSAAALSSFSPAAASKAAPRL